VLGLRRGATASLKVLMMSQQGAVLAMVLGAVAFAAQQTATTGPLPPLQYTCPHHADHVQDTPGTCPMQMEGAPGGICKMTLVTVRIEEELWYTCPVHSNVPNILGPQPGVCPLDRRQKMPVKVTVHWRCKQSPDERLMEPGRCADGTPRDTVRLVRAHGDHNPRHGGSFFMASDAWHHLEGAYPRAGLFRVYFYDNFTQPIDATHFTARLVLREDFDPATNSAKELEVVPLKPGPDRSTLEAALSGDRLPFKATLKVKFDPNSREHRSDFLFTAYSAEPPPKP
jgi:hypothetical protein